MGGVEDPEDLSSEPVKTGNEFIAVDGIGVVVQVGGDVHGGVNFAYPSPSPSAAASLRLAKAPGVFASLEQQLLSWTRRSLSSPGRSGAPVVLDRTSERDRLIAAIHDAAEGSVVVVHGESDVGKSALALDVVDQIRNANGSVLALSLKDVPGRVIDFEETLGGRLADALDCSVTGPTRLLLLDGGEVAQEGHGSILQAFVSAAADAGIKTMVVVRDDATDSIREMLADMDAPHVVEFEVLPLPVAQADRLCTEFNELVRVAEDPRSAWLLRRLGLVDLVLRSSAATALPTGALSEADVFDAVWFRLVLKGGGSDSRVTPDGRHHALLSIARKLLTGQSTPVPPDGHALASLRSDGILLPIEAGYAWSGGDRFSSDVLRDFAVASLLLAEGFDLLGHAGAPRWAVRAVRLACQARLAESATQQPDLLAPRWRQLAATFKELARSYGGRWSELPWEALFGAGFAPRALEALTPDMLADDRALTLEAVRIAEQSLSELEACDPAMAAALVEWLVVNEPAPQHHREDPEDRLIVYWLRGVSRAEAAQRDMTLFSPLRRRVRDRLQSRLPDQRNAILLEGLCLMGADADYSTREVLRRLAVDDPGSLDSCVENADAISVLARTDPELLAELADAYYIERPKPERRRGFSPRRGEGVRSHRRTGYGPPMVAWYFGPFFQLLRARPTLGIQLITRMLDHAAEQRAAERMDSRRRHGVPGENIDHGLELDILGLGRRFYRGDDQVWAWYRGGTSGPHPCASALLALEKVLDEHIELGLGLSQASSLILREAHNLASAGFVMGLLARHIERVSDQLDGFLSSQDVWELERARAASELLPVPRGAEAPGLAGRERRTWNLQDIAQVLVANALSKGDSARIEQLKGIGQRLIEAAGGVHSAPLLVRWWASHLDSRSYILTQDDGQIVIEYEPAADLAEELSPHQRRSSRISDIYRLHRYHLQLQPPIGAVPPATPAHEEMTHDLASARSLVEDPPDERDGLVHNVVTAVAAGAVHAAIAGTVLAAEDLRWAIEALLDAALNPQIDELTDEGSMFSFGADRSAAMALPATLLPVFADQKQDAPALLDPDDLIKIHNGIVMLTKSPFDEVRVFTALGLGRVWDEPCGPITNPQCRHVIALHAVEAGARRIALEPWNAEAGRSHKEFLGDLPRAIRETPGTDLLLPPLAAALVSALDAARSKSCVADRAAGLRDALLEAYARAACHYAEENYDWRDEHHAALAISLLKAADTTPNMVPKLIEDVSHRPGALADLLRALLVAATYEPDTRTVMRTMWPRLMTIGLDALATPDPSRSSSWHREIAIATLVPAPEPIAMDTQIDATLAAANQGWPEPEEIAPQIERWLPLARGSNWAVSALIGLMRTRPLAEQTRLGLPWVRRIALDDDGTCAISGERLVPWLTQIHASKTLNTITMPIYSELLDAISATGHVAARNLRQRDE